MLYSYGDILAFYRKKKKMTQQMLAEEMTKRGFPTKAPAISTWEKESSAMNICQFFLLCDILDIREINTTFHVAEDENPFSRLNEEGVKKAYEYINLLIRSGLYEKKAEDIIRVPRRKKLYDLPASAGHGEFLDSDGYEYVEVGPEVPDTADFGVRLNGDSMEPTFENHSVVWVHRQEFLESGEIGVVYYDGMAYCKRIMQYTDCVKLLSDNPKYFPIDVPDGSVFKVFGKVVANSTL